MQGEEIKFQDHNAIPTFRNSSSLQQIRRQGLKGALTFPAKLRRTSKNISKFFFSGSFS